MAKTLFVIPGDVPLDSENDVARDIRARVEFCELAATIRKTTGEEVEILDYDAIAADRNPLVGLARRLFGVSATLALSAFFRLHKFTSIFTCGEVATLPLAFLMLLRRNNPTHVSIAYDLTKRAPQFFFRWLKVHHRIDTIVVYSKSMRAVAIDQLGLPPAKVQLVPGHVDARFYRPTQGQHGGAISLGSAGLARRDYATLVRAAADLPEIRFAIVPTGHPLRLNRKSIPDVPIPANVEFLDVEPGGLRAFYAPCDIVGIPLRENNSVSGMTTLLEAMAMGKPVIATGTKGISDFIIDGETGFSVAPGDVAGWAEAVRRLAMDPALRERMGRNARRWVEENSTLEIWAGRIVEALRAPAPRWTSPPQMPRDIAATVSATK
jgi:glycosyltransferase involved in cell wall biosynthesis